MYKYNPRKKSHEQLKKSLVGSDRIDILKSIKKELSLKKGDKPKQHWMIVGPRGMGKSHLLTLLYYTIKSNKKLNSQWIPILFPEELRMANNLPKFLERALKEIALEIKEEYEDVAKELDLRIEGIRKVVISERAEYLFSILSWIHQVTGKYCLFITENLQHLLGKKINEIEQKKLRAYLQSNDAVLFVGSATTVFESLHDHSYPFYHFFHIKRLEDLNFQELKKLIVSIISDSSKTEIAKKVSDNEARLRALYSFAGGNPRMAYFLADILKTDIPDEMLSLMDNILDELTLYFDTILQDIPDHQEEILNTLATYEPAQSPKEIADHLEVPQNTIRNYLKQMKESGYVRIAFSKGKSNYYCLNEYLYRIWYQMRDSSHREETRWLMELLVMLYSPVHLEQERNRISSSSFKSTDSDYYKNLIIGTTDFMSNHPNHCKIIEWCVASTIQDQINQTISQEDKGLFQEIENYIEGNKYYNAIKLCHEVLAIKPESVHAYQILGFCLFRVGQYEESIEIFKKVLQINPVSDLAYCGCGSCLYFLGRYDEAIENLIKAIQFNVKSAHAYFLWGRCLSKLNQNEEALEKIEMAAMLEPNSGEINACLGVILQLLGRPDEAINKYKIALEINPNSEPALGLMGISLRQSHQYEQAIDKFKKILKINPKSTRAFGQWTHTLVAMEHYDEAISIYDAHLQDADDASLILAYAKALAQVDERERAVLAYLQYIKTISHNDLLVIDFQQFFKQYLLPMQSALNAGDIIKRFYSVDENSNISKTKLVSFLILLDKYDIVDEYMLEIINSNKERNNQEKQEFGVFYSTIEFNLWLKLCANEIHEASRLSGLYIAYIRSLQSTEEKETEASSFCLGLFKLQVNLNIQPENIKNILNQIEKAKDVPFNKVFMKVWTCLSEPDSVEAQRDLNDKAIAEIVKEIKSVDKQNITSLEL